MKSVQDTWSSKLRSLEDDWGSIKAEVDKGLQAKELQKSEGYELKEFVVNAAGGKQKTHVVRDATHTVCGWAWALAPAAVLTNTADSNANFCSTCCRSKVVCF